jgi:hypothetical protein
MPNTSFPKKVARFIEILYKIQNEELKAKLLQLWDAILIIEDNSKKVSLLERLNTRVNEVVERDDELEKGGEEKNLLLIINGAMLAVLKDCSATLIPKEKIEEILDYVHNPYGLCAFSWELPIKNEEAPTNPPQTKKIPTQGNLPAIVKEVFADVEVLLNSKNLTAVAKSSLDRLLTLTNQVVALDPTNPSHTGAYAENLTKLSTFISQLCIPTKEDRIQIDEDMREINPQLGRKIAGALLLMLAFLVLVVGIASIFLTSGATLPAILFLAKLATFLTAAGTTLATATPIATVVGIAAAPPVALGALAGVVATGASVGACEFTPISFSDKLGAMYTFFGKQRVVTSENSQPPQQAQNNLPEPAV